MPDPTHPWVSLTSSDLRAAIDPLGAQLSALGDHAGHELLWAGDPAVWAGRAPILFPIVGELAGGSYRLGSQRHALRRHGFARGKLFTADQTSPAAARFTLEQDADTLANYPFRFQLSIFAELTGPTLSLTATVRNTGDAAMPASFGYHPAFRWPLPFGAERAAHFVEFDHDEPAPIRRLDAAGLLTPERHATPVVNRRLALSDALFRDDVVIFDRLVSRSVTYGSGGGPRIRVDFADATYFGVWTKPGAQFICIEPWNGVADPEGFAGDFTEKPGMRIVAPGAAFSAAMQITLVNA